MVDARPPGNARGAVDWDSLTGVISEQTLSRALIWARKVLTEAEVDSPRLDAELLMAHVLGWQRAQIYTHAEQALQPHVQARYASVIARRAQREPLAYLMGHREFYGLDLLVDGRVLIPRPETELLVEEAICRGGRLLESVDCLAIADVGTGCGAIAILLALSLPAAEVYATDLSAPALVVAAHNCRRHGVEGQVHLLQGDLLSPLPQPVDLIVANVPYVALAEAPALAPEISRHEPRQAWNGGVGGLEVIARLLAQAGDYLNDGGSLLLEIGATQGPAVQGIVASCLPTSVVEIVRDGAGLDRVVSAAHVRRGTRAKGGCVL